MRAVLSSLGVFISNGARPRTPLAKGIVLTLAIKVCVVVAMRTFLFGDADRVRVDASVMDHRLTPAVAPDLGK